MDCQGNYRTIGNQEEETRHSALHTCICCANKRDPGEVVRELKEVSKSKDLRPEAKELLSGKTSKWYVFVRELDGHYYVGRTVRHPALDIILPSKLIDCVACDGYRQAMSKGKSVYATYKKRYGARCSYQRGFLVRAEKDLLTAPPLPEYSYDPAMVRQV